MKNKFIRKEYKTIEAMIGLYCHDLHGTVKHDLCLRTASSFWPTPKRDWRNALPGTKTNLRQNAGSLLTNRKCDKIHWLCATPATRMLKNHPLLAIRHLLRGDKRKRRQERLSSKSFIRCR